jgi:hypothetical protein
VFAFTILHPRFPGAGAVSGSWPATGGYHDEGFWVANGDLSTLRRRVGAVHRMLSTYLHALLRHQFTLTHLAEPPPPPGWTHGDRADAARHPVFLTIRCVKGT